MIKSLNIVKLSLLLALFLFSGQGLYAQGNNHLQRPRQLYGQLFTDVMNCDSLFGPGRIFPETKAFVDIMPKRELRDILADYNRQKPQGTTALTAFLRSNFYLPMNVQSKARTGHETIDDHIRRLWKQLTRTELPEMPHFASTLIPLKHPYYVPGGRFREVYYWDSYFSMLGMITDGERNLAANIVRNFADLIDTLGFIPNGNRTYYLGRSQPPVFSLMIELLQNTDSNPQSGRILLSYLPEMVKEHDFWMRNRAVTLTDGSRMCRYDDAFHEPREEMYREDVATGKGMKKAEATRLYRNLRAAAESGHDFSSRWLKDGKTLSTIRTTDIIPVDLNALIIHLEQTIAKAYALKGESDSSQLYKNMAQTHAQILRRLFYDKREGYFRDYVLSEHRQSPYLTAAGIFPLWLGLASKEEAKGVEKTIRRVFLKAGGIVTTPYRTGQQWDAPNGWAPLQWVAYEGLRRYHFNITANTLRTRWMSMVERVYKKTGKLMEKYNVEELSDTGGGEYPNQDGFGWTNGVYKAMKTSK